jgi:hypothetical protein
MSHDVDENRRLTFSVHDVYEKNGLTQTGVLKTEVGTCPKDLSGFVSWPH